MNQYNHLISFDLSSYGVALAIINQFVDDKTIKVFEVSPCGQSAILILLATDNISIQIIKSGAASLFKSQILSCAVIENIHADLLPAYLSQNKAALAGSLMLLENPSVSAALGLADQLLKEKHLLVDFRVIRTFPKNVILTFSTEKLSYLNKLNLPDFKKTSIENIQPSLKSFYEI